MLILGIDPGTATTGYGVIKVNKKKFELLEFGLIETDKNGSPAKRLADIYKQMNFVIRQFKPDTVAIEKLFFATNAKTVMRVGQAQGVMLLSAVKANAEIYEYAPKTIKKVLTGNGNADKKTVQKFVRRILGARARSRKKKRTHFDNSADALAVAICHAIKREGG